MTGPDPEVRPTIYRGQACRRSCLRRQLLFTFALVAVAVALAAAALLTTSGGADPGPGTSVVTGASPAASGSPAPPEVRTEALGAVKVHRGEPVRLRYRIHDPLRRTWAAKLQVLAASGAVVKSQGLGAEVTSGATHAVTFRAFFPAGRYSYVVHVEGARGAVETTATSARLTVLRPLPPPVPAKKAVAAAVAWVKRRGGEVGVAVVDSHGELHGWHEHERFTGASLVKAMLLVAYLRKEPHPAGLDAAATLMIEESDNACAYAVQDAVGMAGLKKVARLAAMQDFQAGGSWIDCKVSAADEARFFHEYLTYVPASRRSFARRLLNGVVSYQRWGIPAATGPDGWTTFFKSGWLEMDNVLMVQAAWMERKGVTWSAAVMTDGNPTRSYGWDTQKGFAGLLLGHEPTPAYLARVLE